MPHYPTVLLAFALALAFAAPARAQDPPSLKELVDRYEAARQGTPEARAQALRAVGALHTPSAAAFLRRALEHESESSVRLAIVAALAANGTPEALRVLLTVPEVALGDSDVRAAAAAALGASHAPEAVPRLLALYREAAQEPAVRLAVAVALRDFPDGPWRRDVDDFWFAALTDGYTWVKVEALRRLHGRDDPRVVRAAKHLLMAHHPPEIHREAIAPLLRAGTKDAFVALFDAAVLQQDEAARDLMIDALAEFLAPDCLAQARGPAGAGSKERTVRRIAIALLARRDDGAGLDAVRTALHDRDEDVRAEAIRGLLRARAADAAEEILALTTGASPDEALAALAAAVALRGDDPELARRAIAAALALPPETRIDAAPTLARLPGPEALAPLVALLEDESWVLRAGAIAALRGAGRKEAIPALIGRLPKEDGRLRQDLADALARLTGRRLGFDGWVWEAWWKEVEAGFAVPVEAPDAMPAADATGYYGIPVVSQRVCFLVDASVSMGKPSAADERRGKSGPPRLAAAKRELVETIGRLVPDVRFNVAFFNDRVDPWRGKLAKANSERKAEALRFIDGYQPVGGTALYDALALALDESDADTIFLLSDGKPGSGAFMEPDSILREIAKKNRRLRIVIHTICVGEPVAWLRELAAQSGGTSVDR